MSWRQLFISLRFSFRVRHSAFVPLYIEGDVVHHAHDTSMIGCSITSPHATEHLRNTGPHEAARLVART
jgi:hypothetical protein